MVLDPEPVGLLRGVLHRAVAALALVGALPVWYSRKIIIKQEE